MLKLSEIRLADATARDMARALNYAMVKSKKTANVLVGKLQLTGPVKPEHVVKNLCPKDTFAKSGKLSLKSQLDLSKQMTNIFKNPKDPHDFTMMDFAQSAIKYITRNF